MSTLTSGLFFGYFLQTGVNASPNELVIQIINTLEQALGSQYSEYTSFIIVILNILPFLIFIGLLLSVDNRKYGLIIGMATYGITVFTFSNAVSSQFFISGFIIIIIIGVISAKLDKNSSNNSY